MTKETDNGTRRVEHSGLVNPAQCLSRQVASVALATGALVLCACSDSDSSPSPGAGSNAVPNNVQASDNTRAPNNPSPFNITPLSNITPLPTSAQARDPFEALFALGDIKTIRIFISEKEWNGLLNDLDNNHRSEVYRRADFLFGPNLATAERVNDVAFRVRGNFYSRDRPEVGRGPHRSPTSLRRVHFKIKFNERFNEDESAYGSPSADIAEIPSNRGRLFRGVRSLNLKHNHDDSSYLQEVFSHDLFHRLGLPAARWAFTRLYIQIGDEPERYMGVYQMGEALDNVWVRRHYNDNSFLFKCLYQQFGPANLAETDDLTGPDAGTIGTEITDPDFFSGQWDEERDAYRPSYDLKHDDDNFFQAERSLNDLIRFLGRSSTQEQFAQRIAVATLLKAQAVSVFVGHWDGYWRNGNNYYLVHDADTSKWVYVLYDFDRSFQDDFFHSRDEHFGTGSDNLATAPFLAWGDNPFFDYEDPVLMERALAFSAYRKMYLDFVEELIDEQNGVLYPSRAEARLRQLQAVIRPHIKGYQAEEHTRFNPDLSGMLNFIRIRAQVARDELAASNR